MKSQKIFQNLQNYCKATGRWDISNFAKLGSGKLFGYHKNSKNCNLLISVILQNWEVNDYNISKIFQNFKFTDISKIAILGSGKLFGYHKNSKILNLLISVKSRFWEAKFKQIKIPKSQNYCKATGRWDISNFAKLGLISISKSIIIIA